MDWTQFSISFLGNMMFTTTLWLWSRYESRKDFRNVETVIAYNHDTVTLQLFRIREEMKDFHGRLCAIEERQKRDLHNSHQ